MQQRLVKIQVKSDKDLLIKGFLTRKKVDGCVDETIYHCFWLLRVFFRDYYKGDVKNCNELDLAIEKFLTGKRDVYYNQSLLVMKKFLDYCVNEGALEYNPCITKGYKYRKGSPRIVQHKPEDITKLLNQPDRTTFRGLRDYAMMLLMLDCGIRPGETLKLKLTDFDGKQIHVRKEIAKTRTERYLPISHSVAVAIQKLISVRHPSWDTQNGILFCGFHGKEMGTAAIERSWGIYAAKIGLKFSPYHLRHTFALSWVRSGGDAFALQKIMGHTRMEMTLNYVHLVKGDVVEAHNKYSPIHLFLNPGGKRMVNIKKTKKS